MQVPSWSKCSHKGPSSAAEAPLGPKLVKAGKISDVVWPVQLLPQFMEIYPCICNLVGDKVWACTMMKDQGRTQPDAADNPETICTPPKMYQPPLPSLYQEPKLGLDLNDGMDWMFEGHGKVVKQTKGDLPPCDDVLHFNEAADGEELKRNLNLDAWKTCSLTSLKHITQMVKDHWDVF